MVFLIIKFNFLTRMFESLGNFGVWRRVFCCIDSRFSEKFTDNMFILKLLWKKAYVPPKR
jgi:hypothetical protein